MTLRARMALALAGLAGLAALLVGVATYVATAERVRAEVDRSLHTQAEALDDPEGLALRGFCTPTPAGGGGFGPGRGVGPAQAFERLGGAVAQCLDRAGEVVHTSSTSVTLPVDRVDVEIAESGGRLRSRTRTVEVDGVAYRLTTVPVAGNATIGAVQLARDFSESQRVLDAIRLWIAGVVLAVSGLGAATGWLVARRATKALVQLTDAAEEVAGTGRLDVDVPPAGNDEPGRLARAFSTMLSALRLSREQQQQLVQDAGHELRTPLTSLRTNVETLRRYDDLPEATRRAILSDLEIETRELGALVDELVQLATDSYDDEPEQVVALDQLVTRVADQVRRRTGRTVQVSARPTTVVGRPRELARAVGNLLDNAAKFSEPPAPVEVSVDHGVVVVRDHGPGIPEADLPKVFERFFRSPASRAKPGSGLGLAIVEQTATAHGGTVRAANHPDGGAVLTFALPEAPPPSTAPPSPAPPGPGPTG